MILNEKIDAISVLGECLRKVALDDPSTKTWRFGSMQVLNQLVEESVHYNPWFISGHVRQALLSIGSSLYLDKINAWLTPYQPFLDKIHDKKTIGVVMAGNIPAVGFHDFLCVLISGHKLLGKLSSQDNRIIPTIAKLLIEIDIRFAENISFTEDLLKDIDAIIATGSDNTSRYFDYYFGKYPHIIRKNRNGIAIINGQETQDQLRDLGRDIFLYFGLGCRNVSKIFIPKDYSFDNLFKAFDCFDYVADNHKYRNNYDYFKSIFMINNTAHYDNGFLLLTPEIALSSPVSVVHYEEYEKIEDVLPILKPDKDKIQCIVSGEAYTIDSIAFGRSQDPEIWDYQDGIDTLEFLLGL